MTYTGKALLIKVDASESFFVACGKVDYEEKSFEITPEDCDKFIEFFQILKGAALDRGNRGNDS